jgi:DNA repair protein RecN (Recombination protein N)
MLTHLQIRDLIIIDGVELDLRRGLTVLTGETGAGKSIVVDALQLIAGGRAGAEVVRTGAERAEVSAIFDLTVATAELRQLLEEQSIAVDGELSVRRVIGADGRSRAYLNGQMVPVQLLREAGNNLIDIHGQHEFQSLVRPAAQRDLLDAYGKLEPLATEVAAAHRAWLELLNRAIALEGKAQNRDARIEFLRYQVRELETLELKEGELAALADERSRLANRGRLGEAARTALALLYDAEQGSAHDAAGKALAALRAGAPADPRLAKIAPLVEDATIQLREAARELQQYLDALDVDPGRQDVVERRLAAIEELARKHRVAPAELASRAGQLAAELGELERAEFDLATLRKEQAAALDHYRRLAQQLSAGRLTAARALSKDITTRMQLLGMTGGRFQIDVVPLEAAEPAAHGIDQIDFRVTANPGQPLRPVAKVASGGELARLSLAVQVASAGSDPRCMVFDEVDAGVGGAIAEIVGRELRALGFSGQVLCVTHLPQVASQGHHHLRVTKLTDGRTTRTTLAELTGDERVEELARMLGGVDVTDKARDHAREMLRLAMATGEKTAASASGKRSAVVRRSPR